MPRAGGDERPLRERVREIVQERAPVVSPPVRPSLPVPPRPPVPLAGANAVPAWVYGASADAPSIAMRAESFRRRARRTAVLISGLALVNGITAAHVPWVLFPAFAMLMGLSARWRPLGDAGLSFFDVVGNRDALRNAGVEPSVPAVLFSNSFAGRARRFVSRVKTAAVAAGVSAVSLIIGTSAHVGWLVAPFIAGGAVALVSLVSAARAAGPLRRQGFRLRDLMNGTWRDSDAARSAGIAFRLREEEVSQLAPPDVVMSGYGERLRLAVDNRTAIRQQLARLGGESGALMPEIIPTVDALVSRIAEISTSLHQLDQDMGAAGDGSLDARIRELRAQGLADDHQMLALLVRQRQSLTELDGRRSMLRSKLESASVTLQNLRLDVLRLGSMGLETPARRDVGHATEQARALSKDLAYLLEGAREADRV